MVFVRGRSAVAVAFVVLVGFVAACTPPSGGGGGGPTNIVYVNPCVPDPATTCDSTQTHIATNPVVPELGKLVLFFHGAGAQPQGYSKLGWQLAQAGFHVLNVRFSGATGTNAACPQSGAASDPDCHRPFRSELVFGENVNDPTGTPYNHPLISVSKANSVMNRVLKLLDYLVATYPTRGWEQFRALSGGGCLFNATYGACNIDWSKTVVMGHSLGSGVALYLSKFFDVDRVGMISGPFDQYNDGFTITVAPWIAEGSFSTPASDMFGLQHQWEPNVAGTLAAWDALGLAGSGMTSVDGGSPPYGGSHKLSTNLTPVCPLDSAQRHNSTAQDNCTPGSPPQLTPAWRFLAGA
jgi:pimeloyl-ACP methyl ester carboxylesterase